MVKKISRLLFLIHSHTLFKKIKLRFSRKHVIDDNYLTKYHFQYVFNSDNPRSFNEWIVWMKKNYKNELWKKCADKLGSKQFLIDNGLEEFVVKTLGVYKNSSEIDLDTLPDDFVLKTNHDCGSVFVCHKGKTNFQEIFKKLDEAVLHKYSDNNGEWVYEDIEPIIFAEELLVPSQSNQLIDYKLFGYNGTYGWGFTGQNRNVDTRFTVFEGNYEMQNVEYVCIKPRKKDLPPRPIHFEKMVELTEKISKILDFVRVDFYETTQGLKIGELTFFSHSGGGVFTDKTYDFKYGLLFNKTNIKKNKQ